MTRTSTLSVLLSTLAVCAFAANAASAASLVPATPKPVIVVPKATVVQPNRSPLKMSNGYMASGSTQRVVTPYQPAATGKQFRPGRNVNENFGAPNHNNQWIQVESIQFGVGRSFSGSQNHPSDKEGNAPGVSGIVIATGKHLRPGRNMNENLFLNSGNK